MAERSSSPFLLAVLTRDGQFQAAWASEHIHVAHVELAPSEPGPRHPFIDETGAVHEAQVATQVQTVVPQDLAALRRVLPPRHLDSEDALVERASERVCAVVITRAGLVLDVWTDRVLPLVEMSEDLHDLDPDLESNLQCVPGDERHRVVMADWMDAHVCEAAVCANYAEWERSDTLAAPLRRRPRPA